jgi:excisionase family DNA binding protein
MEDSALFSFRRAAAFMGFSVKHVRSLVAAGKIKAVPVGLGSQRMAHRIPRAEIDRFLAEGVASGGRDAVAPLPPPPPVAVRRSRKDVIVPRFTAGW